MADPQKHGTRENLLQLNAQTIGVEFTCYNYILKSGYRIGNVEK